MPARGGQRIERGFRKDRTQELPVHRNKMFMGSSHGDLRSGAHFSGFRNSILPSVGDQIDHERDVGL